MPELMNDRKRGMEIERDLTYCQRELDLLILRQPTGEARNQMTEANIHLLECLSKLRDVL